MVTLGLLKRARWGHSMNGDGYDETDKWHCLHTGVEGIIGPPELFCLKMITFNEHYLLQMNLEWSCYMLFSINGCHGDKYLIYMVIIETDI